MTAIPQPNLVILQHPRKMFFFMHRSCTGELVVPSGSRLFSYRDYRNGSYGYQQCDDVRRLFNKSMINFFSFFFEELDRTSPVIERVVSYSAIVKKSPITFLRVDSPLRGDSPKSGANGRMMPWKAFRKASAPFPFNAFLKFQFFIESKWRRQKN